MLLTKQISIGASPCSEMVKTYSILINKSEQIKVYRHTNSGHSCLRR